MKTKKKEKKKSSPDPKLKKKVVKQVAPPEPVPVVEPEENEDHEEEMVSSGSNEAALAAAQGSQSEMSASFKNFRHHPDMENFYRFIYENDLRHEALAIMNEMLQEKLQKRVGKPIKTHP